MRRAWAVAGLIALVITMHVAPAAAPPLERRPLHLAPADIEIPQPEPTMIKMMVEATAYSHECGDGDGVTATGTVPRVGICAVDPRVIPLGSEIWVPGYGWAIAEDTGGAIKGNRIDVFFPTRDAALEWGRQTVTVRIVQ